MVHKDEPQSASVEIATAVITPAQTSDDRRNNEPDGDDEGDVPAVLPANDGIPAEVAHIGNTGLATGLEDHPASVRPEQTLVGAIWVEVGIGVAVVCAMTTGPPLDGTFDRTGAGGSEEILQRL